MMSFRVQRLCRHYSSSPRFFESNMPKGGESIQMPTPLSIGFDTKYQLANNDTSTKRPLVVVAGWMGAKQRQLTPYLEFYHKKNIDTISFAVGPHHVLDPIKGMEQMERLLANINGQDSSVNINEPSCVLFHHFSVGGYLYGQCLIAMNNEKNQLQQFEHSIKAQIFDSPPDFVNIPKGIARSMGIGGLGELVIEKSARAYLHLVRNTSGLMHRESSAAFHDNSVKAPSLWFYSKADPVADWNDCVTVIEKWKAKGTDVEECVWDDTPHIQHARYDPERYFGTLERFLQRNGILDGIDKKEDMQ